MQINYNTNGNWRYGFNSYKGNIFMVGNRLLTDSSVYLSIYNTDSSVVNYTATFTIGSYSLTYTSDNDGKVFVDVTSVVRLFVSTSLVNYSLRIVVNGTTTTINNVITISRGIDPTFWNRTMNDCVDDNENAIVPPMKIYYVQSIRVNINMPVIFSNYWTTGDAERGPFSWDGCDYDFSEIKTSANTTRFSARDRYGVVLERQLTKIEDRYATLNFDLLLPRDGNNINREKWATLPRLLMLFELRNIEIEVSNDEVEEFGGQNAIRTKTEGTATLGIKGLSAYDYRYYQMIIANAVNCTLHFYEDNTWDQAAFKCYIDLKKTNINLRAEVGTYDFEFNVKFYKNEN